MIWGKGVDPGMRVTPPTDVHGALTAHGIIGVCRFRARPINEVRG
jgi:hypothetical protein